MFVRYAKPQQPVACRGARNPWMLLTIGETVFDIPVGYYRMAIIVFVKGFAVREPHNSVRVLH